ncbi:golgi family complex component [Sporothrix brasiliensis 5110]|uniref:Golgi family complex component n=1 Tax=Sporothrix brasiliensis 5110 TaxID=1398154 RepID=A0A0C2J466_9PEZI|nr:golgi family complex component [Sporothrix brasiliensis 5110]KIH91887.1 golgi family complex component [Sporothrix brasiliensis 5110]
MSSSLTERDGDGGRDDVVMGGGGAVDEDVPELPEPGSSTAANDGHAQHDRSQGDDDDDEDSRTIRGADAEDDAADVSVGTDGAADGEDAATTPTESRPEPPSTPVHSGNGTASRSRYRELLEEQQQDSASEDGSALGLPRRPGSPGGDSFVSVPDSSASNRNSIVSSAGGSSVFPSSGSLSRFGLRGASPSFRPFDQRFQSRIASPSGSSSGLLSPAGRPSSPGLLHFNASHNRSGSVNSQLQHADPSSMPFAVGGSTESPSPPWEVVRWTKLTKLSSQCFSESAKRNFGSPTCMAVSASIVVGTTKGVLLVFDYNQTLKLIIGMGTKAVEAGAITSVAISSDYTTVAGGHADGSIFTWETSRSSRPFLHIPPMDAAQAHNPGRTASGHMPGFCVTHLGFLGTRRTALVSADDRGMAFAHLATRGTGALGRTVKTSRILGRYPGAKPPVSGKQIKPSTVLAFAPLPLGNLDRATDSMGLTAMLTPYLLVIVSTTPVANTQHKSPRPKEVAPHSAMSGCLAWFPAVRLNVPDPRSGDRISRAKLVYCWSNVLTVLDVDEIPSEDKEKQHSLHCKARSRWKCEEAIVAVQWLTRSVLAVLTISQRLIVLEDHSMRVTEAFDLLNRYIYHTDLFSRQLQNVVETLDEADTSMHGVVADAFYMSFKAYKGRLFLLGFNDMAIGALSNWADRLIALMEHGDYVGAIQLATSFYTGDADKHTIGLPEHTETRHTMVQERLMEIMAASLKYAFSRRQHNRETADDSHLRELAQTCFAACESVGDTAFVFDEMFEWFEESGTEGIFLETLEPYILEQTITAVPPTVVKAMVGHYVGRGMESRLEEIICHMNTATLDLDQITSLCKQHGLYDALVYVWNQAMRDFITPLIDLLSLLVPHMPNGEYEAPENAAGEQDMHDTNALKLFPYLSYVLTGRIYPTGESMDDATQQQAKSEILWFLFSGKSVAWPRGTSARRRFLTRPNQSQEPSFPYLRMILKFHAPSFLSALNEAFEDSFLNDSPDKQLVNGSRPARDLPEEQVFGLTVDRQYILSILIEIMNPADFAPEDTIYLDMFIARNLPKYPQYLLIPESTLTKVLAGLCHYPGGDLEEDAQLSAEYLLSVYHPPDMASLIPLFKAAGFYRILKRIYRTDKHYGKLVQTYFEDPDDQHGVFACIAECLRLQATGGHAEGPGSGVVKRRVQEVHNVIREHSVELVVLDPAEAARTLDAYAPELHPHVLDAIHDRHDLQYTYLKTILEDAAADTAAQDAHADSGRRRQTKQDHRDTSSASPSADSRRDLIEQYVRLMCEFDPQHVSDYVGMVQSANLRLEGLLPTMEDTGVIDAAVVLMAQDGQVREAMGRLVQHLHALEAAVQGLLTANPSGSGGDSGGNQNGTDTSDDEDARSDGGASNATVVQRSATEDLMRALQRYTHVGIWLCQRQADTTIRRPSRPLSKTQQTSKTASDGAGDKEDDGLSPDEKLWLDLIDATVQITRNLSSHIHDTPDGQRTADAAPATTNGAAAHTGTGADSEPVPKAEADKLVGLLRSLVQHTFTALLTTTSSGPLPSTPSPGRSAPSRSSSRRGGSAITGAGNSLSFLRILKAFLTRAAVSSPSLADLRTVLASIFSAYTYEASILRLANRLLERSLFVSVQRSVELRQRGWRAKKSTCEACGRRVWGPGVVQSHGGPGTAALQPGQGGTQSEGGLSIYEAWEAKQAAETERRNEKKRTILMASRGGLDRGKGKDNGDAAAAAAHGTGGKGKDRLAPPSSPLLELPDRTGGPGGRRTPSPRPGLQPQLAAPGGGDAYLRPNKDGAVDATVASDGRLAVPGSDGGDGGVGGPRSPSAAALGPLVLFACRHIYHQRCLDALEAARAASETDGSSNGAAAGGSNGNGMVHKRRQHGERDRDYVCPIDG